MNRTETGRTKTSSRFAVSLLAAAAIPVVALSSGARAQTTTTDTGAVSPVPGINSQGVNPGAVNNGTSIGPSEAVSAPLPPGESAAPLPTPEALFPNLFGLNPILRNRGIAATLDTRNEFAGVISGPRRGSSNAGQYGFEVDIDWEKLAGLRGFETHYLQVGRYGIPISRAFGDQLDPSQEIYGAGGNTVAHLVYAYAEETLANGRFDLAAGRFPLLDDFAASPLYCNYENNAFCGNPKASSDNFGFSSYPDANWAIRTRVRPVPTVYVQTGIYFNQSNIYNYAQNYRSGFTIDASYINGETFPLEIGWEPQFGPNKLPGHYKLGFWYDNDNHPSDLYNANGAPYPGSGLGAAQVKGETAYYALADQMIMRNGPGDTNGLIALAAYYHNSARVSTRTSQAEAGLIDSGFWKARPLDTIDLGFSWIQVSPQLARAEEIQQMLGILPQPTPGSISSYINATGVQSNALVFEANYQIHVYRGVTLAPDFQYFVRPNGQTNLPDAALLGFISHIQFF